MWVSGQSSGAGRDQDFERTRSHPGLTSTIEWLAILRIPCGTRGFEKRDQLGAERNIRGGHVDSRAPGCVTDVTIGGAHPWGS